jgi:predicted DCC family thiol-disulfide oxidoreductase YuxK
VRTVIVLESLDVLGAIRFTALQRGGFELSAVKGMDSDTLLNDIHIVSSSGKLFNGVDAYAQALTRFPLFFWLGWLMRIPGLKQLFGACYRAIADSRITKRCIEDNCGCTLPEIPVDSDSIKLTKTLTIGKVRVRAIAIGMIALFLFQINSTYNSSAAKVLKQVTGWDKTGVELRIQNYTQPLRDLSKVLWGIKGHDVFLDEHFVGYNHIIAIEYLAPEGQQNIWLPITKYSGFPDEYQVGPIWARWGFRVNGTVLKDDKLHRGFRDFTAYWIGKTHHSFKDARFRIWVKYMDSPSAWEYNFLRNQLAKPWHNAGTVRWLDRQFSMDIANIEEIR